MFLGHGVEIGRTRERVAAGQSLKPNQTSVEHTIFTNGLGSVDRTGGEKRQSRRRKK